MDSLCLKISQLEPNEITKCHDELQKCYNESNTNNKMLILISYLVNKHPEIQNFIPSDGKLDECNLAGCNIEEIKYVVSQLIDMKGNLQMNQLFIFMMLHRMHWVTVFGKLLCTLSLHKEENLLNLISHHPCVTYVWPAVLSMLWEQHSTNSGIFQLSYKTIQRCAHLDTPLISQVEVALNRVKRFSAWTQSIAIFLKIPPDNDFVLRMFGEHSLLYVVHQHVNFHLDNVGEIENFLLENSESNAWQVPLFHAYIILYNTALLIRDSNQFTVDEFSKKLEDILKPAAVSLPFKNRLEISNCILSMFFLTQSDLKESSHEKYHISDNCDNMLLDDVDKLHVLTCTLQNYVTCDTIPSELEEETKQLQNNLEEIHWKMSTIQHLTRKSLPSLNLGQQLYGQTKSDIDLSKVESCPLRLLLSSPQDFAMYSIVQGDLDLGVQVVERYNLSDANEGRQILTMNHYYNMIETIRTAPSHNTHEVVLQEVEKFLSLDCFKDGIANERTSTMRLTTLTDILSSVPMQYSQSKKLLSAVSNEVKHNDVHLKNFSSLLSHLKRAQSELSKCIRDDLTPPSTTLVDFLASGSSQRDLMFWRSLESLMEEFSGTEQKRLEETFVNLVNVIKQSPYHELEGDETEESKPFSSAIQKLFLYLSSIDSIMSERKGNLLSCMDEDLSLRIGEAIFVRNEAISSLDLPFVNIPYHLVNYSTGSISLKYSHLGLKELIVLNRDGELKTPVPYTLPASDTVASLLSTLLSQLEPHPSIHLDLATQIAHSRCLERVFMETQKLARIDIRKYMEGEDATAFLINLYNLMWVHALLALEITGEFSGLISKSITCRCLTKLLVSYHLGQAGPVSLHHIEALLLDNYAHVYSTLVDQTTGLCDTEPLENPLVDWNVTRDPRTVFALANAYALSPCIEVLIPADNLDLTLERRMSQYASRHIFLLNNTLNVPILIFSYLDHVTSNQRPECELSSSDTSSNQSRETRAALIEFIKEYTSVRSFILARKDVHVLDEIRFNIRLNYADPVSPVSLPKSDFRIESHVVDYVAESDLLLGGILAALAKANPVPNTPSKLSKNKRELQSPTPDSSQHKAYSHLTEHLEILSSNSRRAQLLSKLDPGKHPLVCLLNWHADPETVWAALEQEMNRGNYVLVLEILYYVLTPRVFMEDVRLRTMYDTVLQELAATCDTYILDVTSLNTIADFVLNNPDATSLKCLQYLSARSHEIEREKAERIEKQFFLTKLNHEITETCGLTDRSINDDSNSYDILRKIIESKDVDLAQRWCVYRNLPHEDNPDLEVLELYFIFLLDTGHTSLAENLCSALSSSHLRELCTRLISSDCDVTHVRVVVNQAMSRCKEHKSEEYEVYVRTVIGVDMLCLMIEDDQRLYRHLISSPYLLIEQILLLTRLSLLEKILAHMKPYLMPADTEPEKIPAGKLLQSEIDALLRTYATKALDFRICDVSTSRTVLRNDKLYSSFSPPRTPPTKEEWIPNDECTECMVCRVTIFSMFNRRHHCRRCGRLVCAACSEHRMKVSGYGSIAVRVCTQCHVYASPRSLQLEVTCLSPPNESIEQAPIFTNRSRHNATLREEFSYEYAPSVSLCLSILQFHSQNTTLAMYLCETCTGLLHLMKPSTREIDFSFVLRMIKCLVLACKVIYDVHGVESTTLDEICTQVNLLSILVNNNCCHLIPEKPLVGQNALRQLRDSLLKEERWSLALEVSTKAGLDYNSVWTVWGKACLKAGAWSEARTIFTKCHFDKRENSTLIDILQILQSDMYNGGDLSTRLSRLKSPLTSTEPSASDSPSYTECLYYLHAYGSDAIILRFYIHRENLRQALDYVRQKTVSPELFVEHVFLRCLKLGMTESLFNLMEEFDVSLLSWKHYLRTVCSHCERSGLLNVLYAIQLRTHDHVRAAITCVRFYLKGAGSYAALKEREYQLTRARGHLNDRRKSKQVNHLAMQISPPELNKQLALLDFQTKLVYVIVSTNQELANRFTSRVATLFGGVDEKAHLLADVLSLETGGAMEGKFRQLCRETVTALSLNPLSIYSELFSLLAKQGRIPDIKELLVSLKHSLGNACDDILVAAIRQKPPQVEQLISVVSKIPLQISLFIETGKLKSAYLLCVKHNRLDEIRTIATRAKALNQTAILNICLKKIAMEEAKESGKNISSDRALSQQVASSQSPRTNAKLGRTIFVRPDSMSLISSQSSSSDSFASLLSEIRLAEEKSLTGSKTPTAPRVNFQLPESSKSNPSSSSKSGRISTSPRERSRRYPGSSNSPAQQESIASVLKMYEENRLRESQMLGRVELGDSGEGVSKSQQNSPSERRLKSVRTSKASPQTPQDRSVSFIGESSISELPGSKVSSLEQSLGNFGTRVRSDLDSSTTPSSFSRQSSHSSMLGLTSDASTSQTSSSRILNRSARSQTAFSPNLVGQRDLDSVEQESIASVLRRYEENRLRESKQVQPKKDKDSLR